MEFQGFFKDAKSSITIVGTNPLIPHLEQGARFLADLLILNKDLRILILCESDNENFSQALCTTPEHSSRPMSFAALSLHRNRIIGAGPQDGLIADIRTLVKDEPQADEFLCRIEVKQANLRLPVNVIEADGRLWCSITTNRLPDCDSYFPIEDNHTLRADLLALLNFYTSPDKGGIYLSSPKEVLIQLFDRHGIPRGIFPRASFYTTEFSRYSIWGFVFNRRGQILLHQRSMTAMDGRGLWDKSVGGHVELLDTSTSITAERELVEEMFLPQAEYTKYLRADLGDIINFGDWNPKKRPERSLKGALGGLTSSDWAMFRATDRLGEPLTVDRISDRRLHENGDGDRVTIKRTVFRSDVYFFIAPPNYLDTSEQMHILLSHAELSGAAQAHKLLSTEELRTWISQTERDGVDRETFTDDLLFINLQYREMLEDFAEFVRFASKGNEE